ncbi:MAG TPA: hypothetical protein VD763_05120 [Candidatus Saccharimonadales bacterium]|nr:hypothetical protein [Candidatus Saccharimonadales bacterium]
MPSFDRSWRRRWRVLLGSALIAPLLLAGLAVPVMAECNPSGADLSFLRTAPAAQRIVVGRVLDAQPDPDGQGPAQDGVTFTLDVRQVLRGPTIAELRVDHLETGGCVRWLSAKDGDVIALAYDTRGSGPTLARATAAWIEGRPRSSDPYETLTMAEVRDVVARPRPPDTATVEVHPDPGSVAWRAAFAAVAGSLAALLIAHRRPVARSPGGQHRGT